MGLIPLRDIGIDENAGQAGYASQSRARKQAVSEVRRQAPSACIFDGAVVGCSGQATIEFAVLYTLVLVPLTFGIIFISQMLWIWHSVVDFTRDGARYAATHCYEDGAPNVISYMQANVPPMIDQDQFQNGPASIDVAYYQNSGAGAALGAFSCDSQCSVYCQPDVVSVGVSNYQFDRLLNYLNLPPIQIPPFTVTIPTESLGCDPATGACTP
jgi:Flp pilus assembly protein TadG